MEMHLTYIDPTLNDMSAKVVNIDLVSIILDSAV